MITVFRTLNNVVTNLRVIVCFRVVQRNLVFVVGLSQRLADPEVLKKHEYFGKYGKTIKVVINQSTSYAGAQVGVNMLDFLFSFTPTNQAHHPSIHPSIGRLLLLLLLPLLPSPPPPCVDLCAVPTPSPCQCYQPPNHILLVWHGFSLWL